jgi:hypothetical protein
MNNTPPADAVIQEPEFPSSMTEAEIRLEGFLREVTVEDFSPYLIACEWLEGQIDGSFRRTKDAIDHCLRWLHQFGRCPKVSETVRKKVRRRRQVPSAKELRQQIMTEFPGLSPAALSMEIKSRQQQQQTVSRRETIWRCERFFYFQYDYLEEIIFDRQSLKNSEPYYLPSPSNSFQCPRHLTFMNLIYHCVMPMLSWSFQYGLR